MDPNTSAIAAMAASSLPGMMPGLSVDQNDLVGMMAQPVGQIGVSPTSVNSLAKGSNLASPVKGISRTRGIPAPGKPAVAPPAGFKANAALGQVPAGALMGMNLANSRVGNFQNMAAQAPSQDVDLAGIKAVMDATARSAVPGVSQRTSVAANAPDSIMGTPEMTGGYSQTPEGAWAADPNAPYSGKTPMEAVGKMGLFDQLRTGAMFSGFGNPNMGRERGMTGDRDPFQRTASLLTSIDRGTTNRIPMDPRSFWRTPRY